MWYIESPYKQTPQECHAYDIQIMYREEVQGWPGLLQRDSLDPTICPDHQGDESFLEHHLVLENEGFSKEEVALVSEKIKVLLLWQRGRIRVSQEIAIVL